MRKTIALAILGLAAAAFAADPAVAPKAIIHTSMGDIHCTLFSDKAPIGTANFIGLANGKKTWIDPKTHQKKIAVPLYDNTTFHRVIPEFMIQGGDPLGSGYGDPGYKFKNETPKDLTFDRPGRLAYANSGPDTNGSQFFITEVPVPQLNGNYTIFGQCEDPELVQKIARVERNGEKPRVPVVIKHIEIVEAKAAPTTKLHSPIKKPATPKQ